MIFSARSPILCDLVPVCCYCWAMRVAEILFHIFSWQIELSTCRDWLKTQQSSKFFTWRKYSVIKCGWCICLILRAVPYKHKQDPGKAILKSSTGGGCYEFKLIWVANNCIFWWLSEFRNASPFHLCKNGTAVRCILSEIIL